VRGGDRGADIQKELVDLCHRFERPDRYSEPDVIVDLGEGGIVLIEVKYRSGNDLQPADYCNWSRYALAPQLNWTFEDVKASGCYELARNWFLLKNLAGRRPATLVNLGSADLFRGKEGARLDRFDPRLFAALGLPSLVPSKPHNPPNRRNRTRTYGGVGGVVS
jgi:hypothetical protein